MTRRKRSALLAVVVVGLIAAMLAWPRPNHAAREVLATLRDGIEMVEPETVDPGDLHQAAKAVVKLDIQVLTHCLDDATAGLFVQPGQPSRLAVGRVRFANPLRTIIDGLGSIRPYSTTGWGTMGIGCALQLDQTAPKFSGFEVSAKGVDVSDHNRLAQETDWRVIMRPRLTRQTEVLLELESKRDKTSAGKITFWARSGETLIVAGLKQPARGKRTLRAPLLSTLPRVGSWFTWTYERDVEQELILLVRPDVERSQ